MSNPELGLNVIENRRRFALSEAAWERRVAQWRIDGTIGRGSPWDPPTFDPLPDRPAAKRSKGRSLQKVKPSSPVPKKEGKTLRPRFSQAKLKVLTDDLILASQRDIRLQKLTRSTEHFRSHETANVERLSRLVTAAAIGDKISDQELRALGAPSAKLAMVLSTQGARFLGSKTQKVRVPVAPPTRQPLVASSRNLKLSPKSCLTQLGGPLCALYGRAVKRGYAGTPESWLRSASGKKCCTSYQLKTGRKFSSETVGSSVGNRTPLYWCVGRSTYTPNQIGFLKPGLKLYHFKISNLDDSLCKIRGVARLPLRHWPLADGSYFAFPTLDECMDSLRRSGKLPEFGDSLKNHRMHRRGWDRVPNLLRKTISKFVFGVRSDVCVPVSLRAYFKYRWGCLILDRRKIVPPSLQAWLVLVWKRSPMSVLTLSGVRFNVALNFTAGLHFRAVPFVSKLIGS